MTEGNPVDQSPSSGAQELTSQELLQLGVLLPAEVDRICAEETITQFVIEGLLPAKSIAIVAGDSTIGKSPLVCQLALCVAANIPFLGMKTNQRRVLYFDLENSLLDCKGMRDAQVLFLGLGKTPDDFLLVTEPGDLERLISVVKPGLVVIDSLRAFRPDVTEKNPVAGEWLKEIRRFARKYNCCFVFIHHLRKPKSGEQSIALTGEIRVVHWLLEMEGPRAFVNQTDVRVAVAEGDGNPSALQVKWSRRVYGDSPLVQLERIYDEYGEPAGYRQLTGADFLNSRQRDALAKLPDPPTEFSFKEARKTLGEGDNRTGEFLAKCKQLELIEKPGKNRYRKLAPPASYVRSGDGVSGVSPQLHSFRTDAPPPGHRSEAGVSASATE
ncbi:MAG: AAA family ATPase [Candidatus Acidiferrales bacterium]